MGFWVDKIPVLCYIYTSNRWESAHPACHQNRKKNGALDAPKTRRDVPMARLQRRKIMKKSTMFVIFFFLALVGCRSAGGSYSLHDESMYHKHTIESSRDSDGQPTVVETRIVKPEAQRRFMARGHVGPGGVTPGSMGSSIYLSPPKAHVTCTVGEDVNGRTIKICPTRDGLIPLVEDPNGTANQYNEVREQTVNNAAAIQEMQDCLNSGRTDCR